jgi:hypothetical protein
MAAMTKLRAATAFLVSAPPHHQPCTASSSLHRATPPAPIRRLPRSPEHPAASVAATDPPARVARRPRSTSSRESTTHGCGLAWRCSCRFSSPPPATPSPEPRFRPPSPVPAAGREGRRLPSRNPLSLSLGVSMTSGPGWVIGPTCRFK